MDTLLHQMGERIMARRKQLRWTQEELAEAAGVTPQTISTAELGKRRFGLSTLSISVRRWTSAQIICCLGEFLGKISRFFPKRFPSFLQGNTAIWRMS